MVQDAKNADVLYGVLDGDQQDSRKDSNTNTDSDRVLITKRAIFQALCDLLDEGDFTKITVGDILARAGVSRTTFYRCFADKYDVVNWSYKRYKNIYVKERDQYHSFETALAAQLRFLRENQRYFVQALRYLGQNSLRDSIFETNEEYMLECWHEAYGAREPSFAESGAIRFAAAGMSKIIECWLLEGCQQEEIEVVRVVCATMSPTVLETLY